MKTIKLYIGITLFALCLTVNTFADGDMQGTGKTMLGDMQGTGKTLVGDMQGTGKTVATNNKKDEKLDFSIFQTVLEFLGLDSQF